MKHFSLPVKLLSILLSIMLVAQTVPLSVLAAINLSEYENAETTTDTEPDDSETAYVLGEDTSRRENSNIKYFMMSDGTIKAAIYKDAVHYQDENGTWQDINNTLVSSDSENDEDILETKNNKFKVKFAKNSKHKKLVSIKTKDYSLDFSLVSDSKNSQPAIINESTAKKDSQTDGTILSNVSQKVSYENILNETDLEYIVSGSSIKENIIIKSIQEQYVYTFEITAKKVELVLEDGYIFAIDTETQEKVFTMPKPFAIDNAGELSMDVQYTLTELDKKTYQLTVTADTEWMNSEDRVFPITIDPGIQTEQSNTAMDSVYVASGLPTSNRWSDPMIMVGRDSSSAGKCQGLLKFELPTLNRGDVVIGAQLSAVQIKADAYSTSTPDTALEVHAVTSSWNKNTVTWNTKPSYESITADFEILKASEAGTTLIQRDWNVTSIVKRWYEDPDFPNYGFLLRSSSESATELSQSCIYAWLYGEKYSQSTAGYPILTIVFRSNKGIESYWSYTSLSAGRAGTASICDFSGNLVFTHADVATSGERLPISVSHVYNGYMANEAFGSVMPYRGKGWMINYQQQLLPSSQFGLSSSAQAKYPYVYIDGDGTEHYFLKKSDGTIVDEDGMGLTLTLPKSSNDFYYKLSDDKGNETWFNIAGALAKYVDTNGNVIANYYTSAQVSELTKVRDGSGRNVRFICTSDGAKIGDIIDPAGRYMTFGWVNDRLTNITYSDGEVTTFTYDSDGAMTSVTSPDGYSLEFSYTPLANGKRVSRVVEKTPDATGQTITFDYSEYGTTVMRSSGKDGIYGNSDDLYTTTRFDSAGRTISSEATSNNQSLGATSATYTAAKANSTASNVKQLNRLSKSLTGGQYTRNYLREGNVDQSGYWTNSQWKSTAVFDGYVTSTDQLYGRYSYYVNSISQSSEAGARVYQTLTTDQFDVGATYTFSAWVKTKNVVPQSSKNFGAELMGTYWLPDGTSKDFHSESVLGTTDEAINNGWQRISVTFTVPFDATKMRCNFMIRDSLGEAWFDGLQLEKGESANPFNMINNSSFELFTDDYVPTFWTGFSSGDGISTTHVKDSYISYQFSSTPKTAREVYQQLYVGGNTANLDDTYILSAWAYANPVGGNNEGNKISLCAKVLYSDGTTCLNWFNYDSSIMGWQYLMGAFTLRDKNNPTASKTPTGINIYAINYYQSNSTWFDNFQLVRDEAPTYTYDSDGNLTTVVANAEQNSSMEYTNHNLTKYTDAKGYSFTYTYDNKHNMTEALAQNGITKYCYQYDANGNPTALSIKGNNTMSIDTSVQYTSNGAFAEYVYDQNGAAEIYSYNDAKGTLTSYTDKMGNLINYTYDADTDVLTCVSQSLSDGRTVQNTYSYEDYRLKTITHNGFNYSFNYDSFGNVTQTKVGTQTLATNTYGSYNGDLQRVTYGNGAYVDYTYDDYGNVVSVSQNGTEKFKWKYDSTGNLHLHEDIVNNQKFYYTYDSTDRLVRQSVTNRSTRALLYGAEYGYDLNNNVNRFTSSAGGSSLTETFAYGKNNLPSSYYAPSGVKTTYSHDSLLRRNKAVINTTTPITYKIVYWMSDRCVAEGDDYRTTQILRDVINEYNYKYFYDTNGNITSITLQNDSTKTDPITIQQFEYDELNQLIRADDLEKNCTEVYNYDVGGNITSVTTYPLTWGSLNGVTATSTVYYTYGDSNWKDKLTAYNGTAITYDAIGNPLSYRGYTLTWQNGRQLASLSGNGVTASYTYDTDGLRTSKTVNGVKHDYYYLGTRLQYETFGSSKLWFFYDVDGNPSGVRYYNGSSTAEYYFVCNSRGDVMKIYDSTGALVANYNYDAWGNMISVTNVNSAVITSSSHIANVNPIRYRGYYYDTEVGLYYINARYYDPESCRFISSDTTDVPTATPMTLTDKNLYAYCDNNPIVRVDHRGDFWDTAFDVVSLCVSVVDVIKEPSDAMAWVGLAADVVSLVLPFATSGGAIVKAITKSDDVSDAIKTARKVDYYVTPAGDAIPATRKAFDNNLSKLETRNNKYYGNDSRGPVRIRVEKHDPTPGYKGPNNPYHCNPHFHIDRREKGSSGSFREVFTGLLEWLRR